MIHIGIDPGINGGIAVIENGQIEAVKCMDTIKDMADHIASLGCTKLFCIIEKVHAMPGNGVVSMFKFGMNYGQWLAILASHNIPYKEVPPQTWMKFYGALPKDRTKRKNHLKHLAQSLYPSIKITLKTADAILIAHWCKQIAPDLNESALGGGFVQKDQ